MSRRLAAITLVAIFLLLLLASAWLNAVGLPDPRGPTATGKACPPPTPRPFSRNRRPWLLTILGRARCWVCW